jgi:hypothetical protein
MRPLRPSLLAAACLLTLAGGDDAHAQQALTASFEAAPQAPRHGELVTFTSTTKSSSLPAVQHTWDLDGDGAFDDAEGPTAARAFDAGPHTVRLRARLATPTPHEDVAERTFTVAAAPTETSTTPAPPTVPTLNLPPVARIDQQCSGTGAGVICLGPLTRLNTPKTFSAAGSTDGDGRIVRYEWDVDGDGSYEADSGDAPTLTTTIRSERPAVMSLRVTDDDGAQDTVEMALRKLEPDCVQKVFFKRVVAAGTCLRKYDLADEQRIVLAGTAPRSGTQYRSKDPVDVNGITVVPAAGKQVLMNLVDHVIGGPTLEIVSGRATATMTSKGATLKLGQGPIRWKLAGNRLDNVRFPADQELGGLKLTGMPSDPVLPTRGLAQLEVFVQLPAAFGGPTSDKPVRLVTGTPHVSLANLRGAGHRLRAAAGEPLRFEIANASIGPIGLDRLLVTYDGDGLWEVAANVGLPEPLGASVEGKAGILHGDFNYAGAEVRFGSPGIGPFGPLFIQRIKFRVEVKPKKSECVPGLGVETYPNGLGGTVTFDYGIPTFAVCGEIGLTAGPQILGARAIALDAGLGLATYDDRPTVLRAFGRVEVLGIPFADARFEGHSDGFMKVSGDFHYGWDGLASVRGNIAVGMLGSKFNAEGSIKACLDFVDWCRGGSAVISSKGIAVCIVIDYGIDDWRPGIGYRWGDSTPDLYFSGCSLGPYRQSFNRPGTRAALRAAGAGDEQTVTLDAGLPGAAIALVGRDAPPKVTLIGPKGERITTPDGLMPVDQKPFFVLKDPRAKLTQIAIVAPSAGRWRIVTEEGSSPVMAVKSADGLQPPKVAATVLGHGGRRTLSYSVGERPGQVVTFIERGASTSGTIGTAKGAAGRLVFTPAAGLGERREIVAIVEQDGMVRAQPVLARYTAPSAAKPGLVHRLRGQRKGTSLRLQWATATSADEHLLTVALSNGRRVTRQVRGSSYVVRGVPRTVRATVAVRGLATTGMRGPVSRRVIAVGKRSGSRR